VGPTVVAATPNEGVCDELIGTTPGLYGLCVAFCEAQDCKATYDIDPDTGKPVVILDPSCKPSSPRLLELYNGKKDAAEPAMPCIQDICPCWTEAELAGIGEAGPGVCSTTIDSGIVSGFYYTIGGTPSTDVESALVQIGNDNVPICILDSKTPLINRVMGITAEEHERCVASVVQECANRPGQ